MRCEDALHYWQMELLGQPVDREKLEEAYKHIGACQELCARTLSTAPDFDLLSSPGQHSGQTDLYEARGLAAEEEGDAHAHQWARLRRLATTGKANQEEVDYERVMALAAWQSAANYYNDGLRIGKTAFLTEGLKRIKRKHLEPVAPIQKRAKTDPRTRRAHGVIRRTAPQPPSADVRSESPPQSSQNAQPLLTLVSHISTRHITVGQHPSGWQISHTRPSALILRETPSSYRSDTRGAQEPKGIAEVAQPQVNGLLTPFELALWVTEFAEKWALELLVRTPSSRRPWSSVMLTLEDREQHVYKPTLMEFSRRDSQMTGWWARLKEITPGDYKLRLSANDVRGQSSEDATLDLHLATEK